MSQNLANRNITHVFVLMLENRSFDHMLGFSGIPGIDAPAGKNSYQGIDYPATPPADFIMPFDPGHEFTDVLEQLCGPNIPYIPGRAYPSVNNNGFVSNYATTKSSGEGGATGNFGEIMKCYASPGQLPFLTTLARAFAVCDQWYASLPGPTWPNRFFVHAASSGGLDHSPHTIEITEWETIKGFSFKNGSIYQLMDQNKKDNYRLYRGAASPAIGSIPCVAALKGIQISDTHPYENFKSDINGDYPYFYTFIEPNYGDIINSSYLGGQSQHPMDDVRNGESLIKSTYEAIRNSPLWLSSLLIVTYDEHGGFYDHVSPVGATAPGDTVPKSKYNQYGFTFEQYGVRVPALVISAYTPKNIISHLPYDHSSVPATIEAMLGMPALTGRDVAANNITALASLPAARTDTPERLPDIAVVAETELSASRATQPQANRDAEPVEGGNLPGFLHIVLKARLEKEEFPETKSLRMDHFTQAIQTRADARTFIETELPGLF